MITRLLALYFLYQAFRQKNDASKKPFLIVFSIRDLTGGTVLSQNVAQAWLGGYIHWAVVGDTKIE